MIVRPSEARARARGSDPRVYYLAEHVLAIAALKYAAAGFRVAPCCWAAEDGRCAAPEHSGCKNPGKVPLPSNGISGASCDPHVVAEWWKRWPRANVALRIGEHLVLDVDDPAAVASLVQALSGRGAAHLWLTRPELFEPKGQNGTLVPGVEWRTGNQAIVVPPSMHKSGRRYEWVRGLDTPMAPAPAWLLDALAPANGAPRVAAPVEGKIGRGFAQQDADLAGRDMRATLDDESNSFPPLQSRRPANIRSAASCR